jgi:3-mercaptopyruvate sulfurtransferase SseA
VALQLKRRGIHRVRPLEGGYAGWKLLGYPVVPWEDGKQELQPAPVSVPV